MYVGHYELELETIPVMEFRNEEPETFGEYIRKLRILKGMITEATRDQDRDFF